MIWIIGSRGIPARYGGFETLAQHLTDGFTASGMECTVIGTKDAHAQSSVPARLLRAFDLHAAETPVLTWWTRPRVRPGDSVLVLNPVNVWTATWLQRRGARVVLHLDGLEHHRAKWGRIPRAVHRRARAVAAKSSLTLIADHPEIQRLMLQEFGRQTVYIAYGGCDAAEQDPSHRWSADRAGDHFLVMARPEPENQVLEICQAFASTETDARLVVVGGPARPTDCWRRIELTAATDPRIELRGSVWERSELCELMMTARAYIHGHTVGGTNPSLVDVLSHGTPVLAHDNVFNRGVAAGSAVYWGDQTMLANALEERGHTPPAVGVPSGQTSLRWDQVIERYRALISLTPSSSPGATHAELHNTDPASGQ
jgi:hypothetical protein